MAGHWYEVEEEARWAEGIEQLHRCISGTFRRPEPRRPVLDYLRRLLSPVERQEWLAGQRVMPHLTGIADTVTSPWRCWCPLSLHWSVTRGRRTYDRSKRGNSSWYARLTPLPVPVVPRLLCRLAWMPNPTDFPVLARSRWGRRHQARVLRCLYRRRLRLPSSYLRP